MACLAARTTSAALARDLVTDHDIIQVDMRNHGLSPRDPVMDYPAMARGSSAWIRLARSRLKSGVVN